jgi:hypothetical protein
MTAFAPFLSLLERERERETEREGDEKKMFPRR